MREYIAIACCKHAVAKTTAPVCLECYKELQADLAQALQARKAVIFQHNIMFANLEAIRMKYDTLKVVLRKLITQHECIGHPIVCAGELDTGDPCNCEIAVAKSALGGTDG